MLEKKATFILFYCSSNEDRETDPLWDLIFPFKCAQTTTTEKKNQTVTLNITVD